MHRQQLLQLLTSYKTTYLEEASMVNKTIRFVSGHENCFERSLEYGHVTVSAWVVNPTLSHVLMLHHRKLNVWLQPGGHADGDSDIINVALKETAEESGANSQNIRLLSADIFDVDIHTIHVSKHDSRHQHFDPRFLVEIDDTIALSGNDESHELRWVPLGQVLRLNNARSIYRMVQKTRKLIQNTSKP